MCIHVDFSLVVIASTSVAKGGVNVVSLIKFGLRFTSQNKYRSGRYSQSVHGKTTRGLAQSVRHPPTCSVDLSVGFSLPPS